MNFGDQQVSNVEKVIQKIAGSVVLYNSSETITGNIESYINQVGHLFVVDNSEQTDDFLVKKILLFPRTTYISCGGNKGIAYALNRAAEMAIQQGYEFLLTMDDDSRIPENMVNAMLEFINNRTNEKIGIVGAQMLPEKVGNSVSDAWFTITSGNLLNLKAYQACGSFLESLFIDWVDHEYCFRLIDHGYKVYELNYLALDHKLGEQKEARIGSKILRKWPSHNAVRMYYKVRNSLYVLRMYREKLPWSVRRFFYRAMLTDLINIVLFEDQKYERLKQVGYAIRDYRRSELGKHRANE